MNFTSGLPVAAMAAALTWYGESSLIRSAHTSSGSPIETQTSVSRTSQPSTAAGTSSLTVIVAPVSFATERAWSTISSRGRSELGLQIADVHPQLRCPDQVGVGHVEPRVPEIAEHDLVQRLRHVFPEREEVRKDLGRVPFVGQTVVDRHASPACQFLGGLLGEAAVLDGVVHASQNAGGVLDGLLVAHVGAGRADEGDVSALIVGGHLERAPGTGRVLLEDQRDLLPDQPLSLPSLPLGGLELGRQIEEVADLAGLKSASRKQMSTLSMVRSCRLLKRFASIGLVSSGAATSGPSSSRCALFASPARPVDSSRFRRRFQPTSRPAAEQQDQHQGRSPMPAR